MRLKVGCCFLLYFIGWTLSLEAEPRAFKADLWQQTSAEYRALCRQTYNWAYQVLQERRGSFELRDGRLVARDIYCCGNCLRSFEKPVAVVMDLDETVIDNSGYQVYLDKTGKNYERSSWRSWVRFQALTPRAQRAVPGAVEFIRAVEDMGYEVVFISNRYQDSLQDTVSVLKAIGVEIDDIENRLFLRPLKGQETAEAVAMLQGLGIYKKSARAQAFMHDEGHKEVRRYKVGEKWYVAAYIGDALSDFIAPVLPPGRTTARLRYRWQLVDSNRWRWGVTWFILPNPTYGYWGPGATLPENDPNKILDDYGFTEYMVGTENE